MKIAVDCAHGAAYKIAPEILWELGADVTAIGVEPNGKNINHECGATHPESLRQHVLENEAQIGIALDGDADRIQLIDKNGKLYSGDEILAILANDWQKQGKLKGQAVVSTIMANLGLEQYLKNWILLCFARKLATVMSRKKWRTMAAI